MSAGVHYEDEMEVDKELYAIDSGYRLKGGFNLDVIGISALTHVPALCPLHIDFAQRKAYVVNNIKVVEAASSGATSLKIAKGSFAAVGKKYLTGGENKYATISAISTSNDAYDLLTVSALGESVAINAILTEATVTSYKKSSKVYADAESAATSVKIAKNSGFVVPTGGSLTLTDGSNDVVVSAIDTSNASYDTLTVTALTAALTTANTLTEKTATGETATAVHTANNLNYARTKIESGATVTALGRAYEIIEGELPIPVSAADKLALTSRFMFV